MEQLCKGRGPDCSASVEPGLVPARRTRIWLLFSVSYIPASHPAPLMPSSGTSFRLAPPRPTPAPCPGAAELGRGLSSLPAWLTARPTVPNSPPCRFVRVVPLSCSEIKAEFKSRTQARNGCLELGESFSLFKARFPHV